MATRLLENSRSMMHTSPPSAGEQNAKRASESSSPFFDPFSLWDKMQKWRLPTAIVHRVLVKERKSGAPPLLTILGECRALWSEHEWPLACYSVVGACRRSVHWYVNTYTALHVYLCMSQINVQNSFTWPRIFFVCPHTVLQQEREIITRIERSGFSGVESTGHQATRWEGCGRWTNWMLYWIMDVNDMYYMDRTHVRTYICTHRQTFNWTH